MKRATRGFTLFEVVVALSILGISLVALLETQAASLNNAARSRDLTIAALLARSKMIDLEKHLLHDGFTLNTENIDGDFRDEGHPDVLWKARISEVEMDLSALTSLCGNLGKAGAGDCENMLGGLGASMGAFTEEIAHSIRVIDLAVNWAEGGPYKQALTVRALITKDDYTTAVENALMKDAVNNLGGATPGTPGTPGAPGAPGAPGTPSVIPPGVR